MLLFYYNGIIQRTMKRQRFEGGQKVAAGIMAASTLLAGCAKAENAPTSEVEQIDTSITSLREEPPVSGAPETDYTRASKCAIRIARKAVEAVMELRPENATEPGLHQVDLENKQSSYVSASEPHEGVTTVKLQVALDPEGRVVGINNNEIEFGVAGEFTVMQTSDENWVEAVKKARDDQFGYPNGGIRVLNLETGEGGSSEDPQDMCKVANQLR